MVKSYTRHEPYFYKNAAQGKALLDIMIRDLIWYIVRSVCTLIT